MKNLLNKFQVTLVDPAELADPTTSIQVESDGPDGYRLLVNSESDFFTAIWDENEIYDFTPNQRRRLKLTAIEEFLKRHPDIRSELLPDVKDDSEIMPLLQSLDEQDQE